MICLRTERSEILDSVGRVRHSIAFSVVDANLSDKRTRIIEGRLLTRDEATEKGVSLFFSFFDSSSVQLVIDAKKKAAVKLSTMSRSLHVEVRVRDEIQIKETHEEAHVLPSEDALREVQSSFKVLSFVGDGDVETKKEELVEESDSRATETLDDVFVVDDLAHGDAGSSGELLSVGKSHTEYRDVLVISGVGDRFAEVFRHEDVAETLKEYFHDIYLLVHDGAEKHPVEMIFTLATIAVVEDNLDDVGFHLPQVTEELFPVRFIRKSQKEKREVANVVPSEAVVTHKIPVEVQLDLADLMLFKMLFLREDVVLDELLGGLTVSKETTTTVLHHDVHSFLSFSLSILTLGSSVVERSPGEVNEMALRRDMTSRDMN